MSDQCLLMAESDELMRRAGHSLAISLYRRPCTITLCGELGAGKTTFAQGFAQGLGIVDAITSPTYALEQRYGDNVLSHIDLYRLSTKQAADFMATLDPFTGIRMIEWSERTSDIEADIEISITEAPAHRNVSIAFHDIAVPSDDDILRWMTDVRLPEHIQKHVRKVADVCEMIADSLTQQGRVLRRNALRAAALTHDLLRFVDFASLTGDAVYSPSPDETKVWMRYKEKYGTLHEKSAEKFLVEQGYPEIGRIVRTHRGHGRPDSVSETIEQYALAYADKRALVDSFVTLDERFNDFIVRYGNGKESADAREWRDEMKKIESFLFPTGVPF